MAVYFDKPVLCPGCVSVVDARRVSFNVGGRSLVLEFRRLSEQRLGDVISALASGARTVTNLSAEFSDVNMTALLSRLDDYGLLAETDAFSAGAVCGKQLISRLEQEHHARQEANDPLPLWPILESGDASQELLTGLAKEYYFLTAAAYDSVTPAVSRLHGMQKLLMINFILGEYRHDKLMLRTLVACGIAAQDVAELRPHPYTQGLTDMLRYWAETDPLSLMCALFIVEGTEQGGKAYISMLRKNDLPAGYLEGIIEHDRANAEGDHAAISREFMRHQSFVSAEEAERVSERLANLHALMRRRNQEVTLHCADMDRVS